eukprot:210359-Karenia_brevis.AAC.1
MAEQKERHHMKNPDQAATAYCIKLPRCLLHMPPLRAGAHHPSSRRTQCTQRCCAHGCILARARARSSIFIDDTEAIFFNVCSKNQRERLELSHDLPPMEHLTLYPKN